MEIMRNNVSRIYKIQNMKNMIYKRMFVVTALLSVSFAVCAQKNAVREYNYYPRNEIYIQYGVPSVIELATIIGQEHHSSKIIEVESRNHKFSGIAALGYQFSVTPRIGIGIDGGFGYGSGDLYVNSVDGVKLESPLRLCTSSIISYTAHLSGSFVYWEEGAMQCSGALYLGFCYMDETVNMTEEGLNRYGNTFAASDGFKFSYHITAIKFRYGETVGCFAELGFGYRGLLNVGLSIKI